MTPDVPSMKPAERDAEATRRLDRLRAAAGDRARAGAIAAQIVEDFEEVNSDAARRAVAEAVWVLSRLAE